MWFAVTFILVATQRNGFFIEGSNAFHLKGGFFNFSEVILVLGKSSDDFVVFGQSSVGQHLCCQRGATHLQVRRLTKGS